jgi:site-specific DNA-methyltransferase (adenine-specific)
MSVFELMPLFVETGWEFFAEVIWAKYQGVIDGDEMPTPGTSWGSFCSPSAPSFRTHTERIWFWYADKWKVAPPRDELRGEIIDRTEFAKLTKDLWVIKGEQHPTHPAVMASEVARRCIMLCTYPEAVVYDPFCGRGTTAIQAALQGRAGIGTDLSASYISLACREAQRAMVPATRVRLIA